MSERESTILALEWAMTALRSNADEVHNTVGGVIGYTTKLDRHDTQAVWDALQSALDELREVGAGAAV